MMTSVEVVRQMAAGKQVLLERESIHAMADILVCRKYKKGEIILNEGEVCECMRYIEKGMTRQFYFKYDKDVAALGYGYDCIGLQILLHRVTNMAASGYEYGCIGLRI